MLKPQSLVLNDKIGIFTPSSPIKEPFRRQGLEKIRELGYLPVEAPDILAHDFYLSKSPESILKDIQDFFYCPEVKALWAARGGYGANYLLPLLPHLSIPRPKIVIGSSDVSYLLWSLLDNAQMVVFYGPLAYSSLPENRVNLENFRAALTGSCLPLEIPGKVLIPGRANGVVTGGCLSNLISLIGTIYFPQVSQRILLLEDTGERPYRLDRMFWQLHQTGVFAQIAGLALGRFPGCFNNDAEKEHFFQKTLQMLEPYRIPVLCDLPVGHGDDLHTIPLGINAEIDSSAANGLVFSETGVLP